MDQVTSPQLLYLAITAVSILIFTVLNRPGKELRSIPTVNPTGALTSWIGGLTFLFDSERTLMKSALRFPGSMYKVRRSPGWQVIVTDLAHVADIKKARDSDLSLILAQNDFLCTRWIFGHEGRFGRVALKMNQMLLSRRTIEASFDILYDELLTQLPSAFPTSNGEDWNNICCFASSRKLIGHVANRYFVGKELCRNNEYLDMMQNMTMEAPMAGMVIALFPKWMQPLVGPMISPLNRIVKRAEHVMGPHIRERLECFEKRGPGESLDTLLDWIIEESEESERMVEMIALRLVKTNFVGLISTSLLLTSVLLQIGTSEEYVTMLREEVEEVTRKHGWTKTAMAKLDKLDSFICEVSRYKTSGLVLNRKVVNPDGFTFSGGPTLPYGTYLAAASFTIEHSAELHEDPKRFDPLRGYKQRQKLADSSKSAKYLASTPEMSNLLFGLGLHACPGRFWIIHTVKMLVARFVATYDLKVKDGVRPKDVWMSGMCSPDMTAPLLYRKRQTKVLMSDLQ